MTQALVHVASRASTLPKSRQGKISAESEPRVLVVDDDEDSRRLVSETLRSIGFVVDEASNGVAALKVFKDRRPQIALLEVMTPFLDGFSTCRAMRELPGGADVCIVMMTHTDDVESLQFGYEAGATDFVTKPINIVLLKHRMKFMLRSADLVDQLRTSERKVAQQAYHDALTGLPNRRALERFMTRLGGPSGSRTGAVFLIDLDGFKRVNDTFGHTAGDELIVEVARRMKACFEIATDDAATGDASRRLIARLGGDEFIFVDLTLPDRDAAADAAARILEAIGRPYELCGHEIVITGSVGISLMSDGLTSMEALVQNADAAMYDAKAHDRNNARFYTRELSDKARAQLDVENALRRAIADSEFEMFYQPKVDAKTGQLSGAEALLRWRHPEWGMVSPADFIPIAEETGLIVPIGAWVVREVCRQAVAWQRDPKMSGLRIAVNVSARQFRDPHLLSTVKSALERSGLDPFGLEIEITEGTLMNDTKTSRGLLDDLKALGIWIALDDFGTGYSSLGYLRRFPIDTLKIDRSFVRDLTTDPGSAAITGAIVAMANQLRLNVVAEGVETAEQLEYLRSISCAQIQGYYFSPAIPVREFEEWAHARPARHEAFAPPRRISREFAMSAIPPMNHAIKVHIDG
jgi:diguanylate cyclase (GGDEF)-like protein